MVATAVECVFHKGVALVAGVVEATVEGADLVTDADDLDLAHRQEGEDEAPAAVAVVAEAVVEAGVAAAAAAMTAGEGGAAVAAEAEAVRGSITPHKRMRTTNTRYYEEKTEIRRKSIK